MLNDHTAAFGSWAEDLSQLLRGVRRVPRQLNKLLLASLGLMATFAVGHLADWIWLACGGGVEPAAIRARSLQVEPPKDGANSGVFAVLLEHESFCLDQALNAARHLEITGGMDRMWRVLAEHDPGKPRPRPQAGHEYGMVSFLVAGLYGLYWCWTEHWFFSVVFGLLAITLWALFGGGICRIAALEFAKDQHLSAKSALAFAASRLGQLIAAPLTPLVIMLLFTLPLLAGGWVAQYVPLFGGLLFGFALLCGGLIALILTFVVGGSSLMWPAIAAEGAEWTDAIGRSSSYFFERIERAIAYALVAILYGALAWMVVRLLVFLLAGSVHHLAGVAFDDLDRMWEKPTYERLYAAPPESEKLEDWGSRMNFRLIKAWMGIGGFGLYGFLVSYYFTCSTIIYFLLRSRVDENELDDVYVEGGDGSPPAAPEPAT